MSIIIVGTCIKKESSFANISFRGVFNGHVIKSVRLSECVCLTVDQSYILHVKIIRIKRSTIYGKLLRNKPLLDFHFLI